MLIWPLGDEALANWNSFVNFTLIQAATSTTGPSTPTGTTTGDGSTSPPRKTTGVIVGASVGGGVGAIALLVIAYLQAHNLWYLLSSLVCLFLLYIGVEPSDPALSLRDSPFSDGGFSQGAALFFFRTRTWARSRLEELTTN